MLESLGDLGELLGGVQVFSPCGWWWGVAGVDYTPTLYGYFGVQGRGVIVVGLVRLLVPRGR